MAALCFLWFNTREEMMFAFLHDVYRSWKLSSDPNRYDLEKFHRQRNTKDPEVEDVYYGDELIHSVTVLSGVQGSEELRIKRGSQRLAEVAAVAHAYIDLKDHLVHVMKVSGLDYHQKQLNMCDAVYLILISHPQYKKMQKSFLSEGWIFFLERQDRGQYTITIHKKIPFKLAS